MSNNDPYIKRIQGVAGGGKTYQIKEEIETALDNGIDPSDILVLTFSKSHSEDLENELRNEFSLSEDEDFEVRTFHSKALEVCSQYDIIDYAQDKIIQTNNYYDESIFQQFFREYEGPEYTFKYQNLRSDEEEYTELPIGNQLIRAYTYIQSTAREITDYPVVSVDVDLPDRKVVKVLKQWDEWKKSYDRENTRRLFQHCDYVRICREKKLSISNSYDLMIVDEMQDLSPSQYGCYRVWTKESDLDKIVICGDPAQTIYSFRGASSTFLEDTEVDESEYLTKTRRCADEIMDQAADIIDPLDYPTERFSAEPVHEEDGTVLFHPLDNHQLPELVANSVKKYVNGENDEIYVLARTNRQVDRIENILAENGIPYGGIGSRNTKWDDNLSGVLAALRCITRNEDIMGIFAADLLITSHMENEAAKAAENGDLGKSLGVAPWRSDYDISSVAYTEKRNGSLSIEAIKEWFGTTDPRRIITQLDLSNHEQTLLKNGLNSDYEIQYYDPPIRVGTIHSSKGRQAKAAIVLTDYSDKQLDRYRNESEAEERRLYYVASTRPEVGLHYVNCGFNENSFPPLSL